MIYLLLITVLLNLYFTVKRFYMSYVTTLNAICIYTILNSLAFVAIIYAAFIGFTSGKNVVLFIICILVSLLIVVLDALTINKYVKININKKDDN